MRSSLLAPSFDFIPQTIKERIHRRYQSLSANYEYTPPNETIERRAGAPNHILVIVIDALRPDFVPNLPLEFTDAIAPAPWTFPSVTSLHTGLQPSDHSSVAHTHPDDDEYAMPAQTDCYPHFPLDLDAAGYETYTGCAFATPFLAVRGWYQTHQYYTDHPAETLVSDYRKWRTNRHRTAAYLHLGDLHAPVAPPDEYVDKYNVDTSLPDIRYIRQFKTNFDDSNSDHRYYRKQKLNLHRAALEYISDQLRELIELVRDDTLIIVTGDHGEALWEHQELDRPITDSRPNYCFGHGGTPFDKVARVPLAVSSPLQTLKPEGGWATLRDIPATILDSAVKNAEYNGCSWHDEIPADRAVICEGTRYGVERKAIYKNNFKVIQSMSDNVTLTAEVSDNGERFIDIPSDIREDLLSKMPSDGWEDMDVSETVSGVTKEQLKALGYR